MSRPGWLSEDCVVWLHLSPHASSVRATRWCTQRLGSRPSGSLHSPIGPEWASLYRFNVQMITMRHTRTVGHATVCRINLFASGHFCRCGPISCCNGLDSDREDLVGRGERSLLQQRGRRRRGGSSLRWAADAGRCCRAAVPAAGGPQPPRHLRARAGPRRLHQPRRGPLDRRTIQR
jgi:hypothetical protein